MSTADLTLLLAVLLMFQLDQSQSSSVLTVKIKKKTLPTSSRYFKSTSLISIILTIITFLIKKQYLVKSALFIYFKLVKELKTLI